MPKSNPSSDRLLQQSANGRLLGPNLETFFLLRGEMVCMCDAQDGWHGLLKISSIHVSKGQNGQATSVPNLRDDGCQLLAVSS